LNEGEKADPQARGIKARGIALDNAGFLKPDAATGTLRGGEADFLGELGIGEAPVGLERAARRKAMPLPVQLALSPAARWAANPGPRYHRHWTYEHRSAYRHHRHHRYYY
jgi:hypothetical protein